MNDPGGGRILAYFDGGPPARRLASLRWPTPPARRHWATLGHALIALVVCAGLIVAVPCGVFAAVGLWFGDASTPSAAFVAAVATAVTAAVAVIPSACRRCRPRRTRPWAEWN